jgi:hypothetical protein
MSERTISSPGVQINEIDLSTISRPIGSTDVLITGFADQGPTEDFVNVSSVSEYEQIFGTPTNSAERYLYYSAKQILLNSPANLMVTRFPYGSGNGVGYANSYSVLAYPISSNTVSTETFGVTSVLLTDAGMGYTSAPTVEFLGGNSDNTDVSDKAKAHAVIYPQSLSSNPALSSFVGQISAIVIDYSGTGYVNQPIVLLQGGGYNSQAEVEGYIGSTGYMGGTYESSTKYALGAPTSLLISDDEYQKLIANDITWEVNSNNSLEAITKYDDLGKAGLIVINESKTSVNNLYEGYYVVLADNSTFNPSTNHTCVNSIKSVTGYDNNLQTFTTVPPARLSFTLTQTVTGYVANSLSYVVEHYPTGYDFGTKSFDDSVILLLVKIKTSQYNQDTVTLDYSIAEGYAGSLYANRTQNNPNGGTASSFFIDTVVKNKSKNIKVITNPNISQKGTWIKNDSKLGSIPAKSVRVTPEAQALFATGVYVSDTDTSVKDLGNVPLKLQRVLNSLENNDAINVDVIAEAGLGTIWSSAYVQKKDKATSTYTFDETYNVDLTMGSTANSGKGLLSTTGDSVDGFAYDGYTDITNQFITFADQTRKDHVFIADSLRSIFIQGENFKVSNSKNYVFSNNIFWPLKNLFGAVQSSYVTTYGNWIKTNDVFTNKQVWLPTSGYAAAVFAQTSQTAYPWIAPAGFNRGTLQNVVDIAINPTQKQRDLLYKINVNPIAYFTNDGFVIYGQKTLFRKPSAFDRINVRRLFLTLEKEAQALLKYFVFEPNTFATRNRLKGALVPIFDQAKLNNGLYDYLLVCDETNNTPDVIDNNELRISIYIQPVRAAEFILADFIATRTGVNFSELVG